MRRKEKYFISDERKIASFGSARVTYIDSIVTLQRTVYNRGRVKHNEMSEFGLSS